MKKSIVLIIFFCCKNFGLYSQILSVDLRNYILSNKMITKEVKDFYALNKYQIIWVNKENRDNELDLEKAIAISSEIGLSEMDYKTISSSIILNTISKKADYIDSIKTEIQITSTAIHFLQISLMET